MKQLDEHDWTGAEVTIRAVLDRRASYRDAEGLLALAQRQGRPEEKHEPPPKPPANKPVPAGSALPREGGGSQATPNSKPSVAARRPPVVIHQVEGLREEEGRLATLPAQRRQESRKSGRWTIALILAASILVLVVAAIIVLENNGDRSNTSPTQSPAQPEYYNKLVSHLPDFGKLSTDNSQGFCFSRAELGMEQLAQAACYPNNPESSWISYFSLWKVGADARSFVLSKGTMIEGDCLHTPPDESGAYQSWSKQGMTGVLTCYHDSSGYHVAWSIDELAISGSFDDSDFFSDNY